MYNIMYNIAPILRVKQSIKSPTALKNDGL